MNESNVSQENAKESLDAVQKTMVQTRQAITSTDSALLLMLWGLVLSVAYMATHFLLVADKNYLIDRLWFILCGSAVVVSFVISGWQFRTGHPRKFPVEKKYGWRSFLFWMFLLIFVFIWVALLAPFNGRQLNVFILTVFMFATVVSGLWSEGAYMVWLGLTVTATTVIGYFLIPPAYFCLWMAPTVGGTLFVTGLYIRLRWK